MGTEVDLRVPATPECGDIRALARRFLLTLQALGYVDLDGRSYRLSAKTLDLAYAYLDSHDWLSIVSPQLEKLKNDLGESVSLTVLDGPEVVYLLLR